MPVTLSIQAVIDAQTTALTTTINTARDAVNTNTNTKTGDVTTAVNAARDNVKADNVTQMTAQTTAINNNTATKTGEVTTAVNAKGAIKSVQRFNTGGNGSSVNITIAAVDIAKSFITLNSVSSVEGGSTTAVNRTINAQLTTATNVQVSGPAGSQLYAQIVELY